MSRRLARKYREYKISTFLTPIVDFQLKFLNRSERCTVDMYYVGISKTVVDMWTFPKLLQTLWTFPQTVVDMWAFPKPFQICGHFQNRCRYVNISKTVIDMWTFPKPLKKKSSPIKLPPLGPSSTMPQVAAVGTSSLHKSSNRLFNCVSRFLCNRKQFKYSKASRQKLPRDQKRAGKEADSTK